MVTLYDCYTLRETLYFTWSGKNSRRNCPNRMTPKPSGSNLLFIRFTLNTRKSESENMMLLGWVCILHVTLARFISKLLSGAEVMSYVQMLNLTASNAWNLSYIVFKTTSLIGRFAFLRNKIRQRTFLTHSHARVSMQRRINAFPWDYSCHKYSHKTETITVWQIADYDARSSRTQ